MAVQLEAQELQALARDQRPGQEVGEDHKGGIQALESLAHLSDQLKNFLHADFLREGRLARHLPIFTGHRSSPLPLQ